MAARLACSPHPIPNSQLRRRAAHVLVCRSSRDIIKSHSSRESSGRDQQPQNWKKMHRKEHKSPRPLIKVSTSDGKYHGEWTSEYALTLQELRLSDLVARGDEKDADVLVALSVQKHAGFGFSIEGSVYTCFTSVCSSCFLSYRREIDTTFNVWVLPSSRSSEIELPEIGSNDPSLCLRNHCFSLRPSLCSLFPSLSKVFQKFLTKPCNFSFLQVIYVKPGSEADLDSLIRDTIRLTASAKNTCSEACLKSTPRWHYTDDKKSYDKRWARLLQIKRNK